MKTSKKTRAVAIRLTPALLDALDHRADIMSKKTGNPTTRAAVIRLGLTTWLRQTAGNP